MSSPSSNNYGPDNPHPLSQLSTELVWEGKYDEYGNRREVDVAGLSFPMQKIETIDEPQSRAEAQGSFFDDAKAHRDDFRNRLIWGDNKLVMASLLGEFKGRIDLIYIDPPFDVGADFTMDVPIGDKKETLAKEQSLLEMVAYRDTWGRGTDSYVVMLYERLVIMRDLLSTTGTIYVHCDWRVCGVLRALLDEIFGSTQHLNEIIWCYKSGGAGSGSFARKHDTIFRYSKSGEVVFNAQKQKSYMAIGSGKNPVQTYYEDEAGSYTIVNVKDWWDDIGMLATSSYERVQYPTQKPEALLERIIAASTNEDGLVADFFCGSGTTLAVAEKLGRRWIGADLGRFAIHTTRKRLLDVQRELYRGNKQYRSFDVYNLGRYERQWWQKESLNGAEDEHQSLVLKFFHAEPLANPTSPLIHGRKGQSLVHVDGIDSLFTREELTQVAEAVKGAGALEVQCLAWDFEMGLRQAVTEIEAKLGVKAKLHRIPREIMEKNQTEIPPFFEVALLEAEPVVQSSTEGDMVEIKLTNFLPSLAEVPSKELDALQERVIESGFDFIDFWAIDFDWKPGQPFNHHWQDYRTRKDRSLKTISDAAFQYSSSGTYTACIKVVDVFGCDTSITVEVKI